LNKKTNQKFLKTETTIVCHNWYKKYQDLFINKRITLVEFCTHTSDKIG
jgi:hypothetical protein